MTPSPPWRDKVMDAATAVARIGSGRRVFVGTGCGLPRRLVRALMESDLTDIEVVTLFTMGEAPFANPDQAAKVHVNTFFVTDNVRPAVQMGLGGYTPALLSDIPRHFRSGRIPLDAALIQVSPPDAHGWCSLGVAVDVARTAVERAGLVIAQVNPAMPRTLGDGALHVDAIHCLVEAEEPLLEVDWGPPTMAESQAAIHASALISDGATVEVGFGRVAQTVLYFLADRREIGIHTEMLTDAVINLALTGVVTGAHKSLDRERVVVSFCLGSRRLYDLVDNNPLFLFRDTEYVNDPEVIARQRRMTAINTALEVDLTGQVCGDSIGNRFFAGIGGQADFNRGAARAHGGKAIIVLTSLDEESGASRIVCQLSPGAGVVTSRGDVHYVVTEHGVAYLHGKTIHQRALALISIAHPRMRERLLIEAVAAHYLHPEWDAVSGRFLVTAQVAPASLALADGLALQVRPVHPNDEQSLHDLFYDLTPQSVYFRFMAPRKSLSSHQLQDFVYVDHGASEVVVAVLPGSYGDDIVAMGGYHRNPPSQRAEIDFIVRDDWQGRGVGSFLLRYLIALARGNGITGLVAEVLQENVAMQTILRKAPCPVRQRLEEGVWTFELDL